MLTYHQFQLINELFQTLDGGGGGVGGRGGGSGSEGRQGGRQGLRWGRPRKQEAGQKDFALDAMTHKTTKLKT